MTATEHRCPHMTADTCTICAELVELRELRGEVRRLNAQPRLEMTRDELLLLGYWIGRADRAEKDADRLYRFVLTSGDRDEVIAAHLVALDGRGWK